MFEGPVSEWNINQVNFAYWMEFYDAIYQADDRPDDWVIADNYLIDNWVKNKLEERERKRKETISKKKGISPRSAMQHQSVIFYDDDY